MVDIVFWSIFSFLILVAFFYRNKDAKSGRKLIWRINKTTSTELISNSGLQAIQNTSRPKGILRPNDMVIVWAQNFLDHDVFYETVKQNIIDGVRYFYILDRKYVSNFNTLLKKLYIDFSDEEIINTSIDVIFIKSELTHNNFVLIAPETERELLYSSIIYDERPIGWLKQSAIRSKKSRNNILKLLTRVAIEQKKDTSGDMGFFYLEDQIMNYSHAVNDIKDEHALEKFPIGKIIESSKLDRASITKIINLEDRVKQVS